MALLQPWPLPGVGHDLLRCRPHQAESGPRATKVGDGHRVCHRLLAGVRPRLHRPGAVVLLGRDQERDAALNLCPVRLYSRETEEVERLPGGEGVAGKILVLTPAAVLVLPAQEPVDFSL